MSEAGVFIVCVCVYICVYVCMSGRAGPREGGQLAGRAQGMRTNGGQGMGKADNWRAGLGSPGVSSRSVSCFWGPFRSENPETDWDDTPGLPRRVIPVRFRFFDQNRKKSPGPEKHPKWLLLQKEFNSGM